MERDTGPSSVDKLKQLTHRAWRKLKEQFDSPHRQEAEKIIQAVGKAVREYSTILPLPSNLQFSAHGKEYVTLRRLDGDHLLRISETTSVHDGIQKTKRNFVLPIDSIHEDSVVVFALPRHFSCINKDKEVELRNAIHGQAFDCLLWDQMFSDVPALYRKEDWKPTWSGLVIAVRKGNAIFRGNVLHGIAVEANHDGQGNAILSSLHYFDNTTKLEAEATFIQEYAKLYVLVGGTIEKETKRIEAPQLTFDPIMS